MKLGPVCSRMDTDPLSVGDQVQVHLSGVRGRPNGYAVLDVFRIEGDSERQIVFASRKGLGTFRFAWPYRAGDIEYNKGMRYYAHRRMQRE